MDDAAFEALFLAHEREVYGWIVRLVRDRRAGEALTIDTFRRLSRTDRRARRRAAAAAGPDGLGLLARLLDIDAYTPQLAAVCAPIGIAVYYLAWKHFVGFFNAALGVG